MGVSATLTATTISQQGAVPFSIPLLSGIICRGNPLKANAAEVKENANTVANRNDTALLLQTKSFHWQLERRFAFAQAMLRKMPAWTSDW